MSGKFNEAARKNSPAVYQEAQNCSRVLHFIKDSNLDPSCVMTYMKVMSSPIFAGMFTVKDKLHDVRNYFQRIIRSKVNTEKRQLLKTLPLQDYESALVLVTNITPESAMQNPELVSALSKYEKECKNCLFALKMPVNIIDRKNFICCKENLQKYREYVYLNHDIFVSKALQLIQALFAVHIFKLNIKELNDEDQVFVTRNKPENRNLQNQVFKRGNTALKFYLSYEEGKRLEARSLQSLIRDNGGICVTDRKIADRVIYIGQPDEFWISKNKNEGPIYSTGLLWEAVGLGLYDPTKDYRFIINKRVDNIVEHKNSAIVMPERLTPEPEMKKPKLQNISEDDQVPTRCKIFEGVVFHMLCSGKDLSRRNELLKLIWTNGGRVINNVGKETVNIFMGTLTPDFINKSKDLNFQLYQPSLITDAVIIGKFDRTSLDIYKYKGNTDVSDTLEERFIQNDTNLLHDTAELVQENQNVQGSGQISISESEKCIEPQSFNTSIVSTSEMCLNESGHSSAELKSNTGEEDKLVSDIKDEITTQTFASSIEATELPEIIQTSGSACSSKCQTMDMHDNLINIIPNDSGNSNSDKAKRRFACFLEEAMKTPEANMKAIAERIQAILMEQFQDEVAIKTLQNNIRTMFLKWEKDGDKFEEQLLEIGVSPQAINFSKNSKPVKD